MFSYLFPLSWTKIRKRLQKCKRLRYKLIFVLFLLLIDELAQVAMHALQLTKGEKNNCPPPVAKTRQPLLMDRRIVRKAGIITTFFVKKGQFFHCHCMCRLDISKNSCLRC